LTIPGISRLPRQFTDSILIFLFACVLIYPLFKLEYLDNWGSIESTFIADARMLREHLPHPAWQPLWYCGTRFDYIYPPALRYGTALTSWTLGVSTARAYHLYIGVLYALGIAGVYLLVYAGSRSRVQGWLSAIFTAVLSPTLFLMPDYLRDSPDWVPQRLHSLMSYGEGPHISAVALLGLALAASFVALKQWKPAFLALAGLLCAAVVANNFYGATALAMFFPILTWAVWLEARRWDVLARAAGIAAIAYGLCAFWLTPSYVRITAINLRWVALPRTHHARAIAIACVLLFGIVSFLAAKRRRGVAWPVFLWGSAIFISIYVLGAYFFGYTVAGNGVRLGPELDLFLILFAVYGLAIAWKRPMLRSGIVVLLCVLCYNPVTQYVRHAWWIFPRAGPLQEHCEFDIPKWIHDNLPAARALPSGSIRFWYDTWNNNSQAHGGSDQGMLNQIIMTANWEIVQGTDPAIAIAWLQALGVDAIIVPDKTSQERYHDYAHPEKFQGALPALYNDRKGTTIYQVPRRFPGIARVVDRSSIRAIGPPRGGEDVETLTRYVAAIERGPDSTVTIKRPDFETIDLDVAASDGQAILLQETFDPSWRAQSDGKALAIERDPMGFMVVQAPPGTHTIHMHFDTPIENRVGWILTAITCAIVAGLCFLTWLKARKSDRDQGGSPREQHENS
jgi:hypothetical protein